MKTRVVGVEHDGGRAVAVVAEHDGADARATRPTT